METLIQTISLLGHFSLWQWGLFLVCFAYIIKKMMKSPPKSTRNFIAVGIDVLVASLIWRSSGITVSSHTAIAALEGKTWGIYLCKFLNWLDPNHCANSIDSDMAKAQEAIDILTKKIG